MDLIERNHLLQFLSDGTYPVDVQHGPKYVRGNFRRKASHFRAEGEILYKIIRIKRGVLERFESPLASEIPQILESYHVDHPAINAMSVSIRQKYFWDKKYQQIEQYIKSCHHCQISSAKIQQPQRELQPISPPERPWQHIGIDLFIEMPPNELGYKHVLVVVCYLSKYTVARPLRTKTSAEVVAELLGIYLTFGVPKICQHDQGKEFTSKEFSDVHQKLGVDNRRTSAYYPQSNGLVEAHNKILKRKIEKLRQTSDGTWPTKLPFAVLAANTTIKRATKFTAFEVMYGRKCDPIPLLALSKSHTTYPSEQSPEDESVHSESLADPYANEIETLDDIGSEMEFIRMQNESEARLNIKIEQTRQKRIYDKKVKTNRSNISEGSLFLARNIPKDKKLPNTRMQPKYHGPFLANSVTKSHIVTVKDKTQKKAIYPVHLCKKYIPRKKQTLLEDHDNLESEQDDDTSINPSLMIKPCKRNIDTKVNSTRKKEKIMTVSEK